MNKRKWKNSSEESGEEATLPIMLNVSGSEAEANSGYYMPNIRVVDNKIYYYADVDSTTILELNKLLEEMDVKLQTTKAMLNTEVPCELHICSYGGELTAAFSTVDLIRRMKSPVHTYIDGGAASAATLISCVGDKRYIGKHASMLIHQLSSGMYGKFTEIEDEYQNLKDSMKIIKSFYKEYTKIPMKRLDELLKHDLWLQPDECLQYSMVDEIL